MSEWYRINFHLTLFKINSLLSVGRYSCRISLSEDKYCRIAQSRVIANLCFNKFSCFIKVEYERSYCLRLVYSHLYLLSSLLRLFIEYHACWWRNFAPDISFISLMSYVQGGTSTFPMIGSLDILFYAKQCHLHVSHKMNSQLNKIYRN